MVVTPMLPKPLVPYAATCPIPYTCPVTYPTPAPVSFPCSLLTTLPLPAYHTWYPNPAPVP